MNHIHTTDCPVKTIETPATDDNPWNTTSVEFACADIETLIDIEDDMRRAKGTMTVGIDADTRARAAADFTKASARFWDLFNALPADVQRAFGDLRSALAA